MRDAVRDSFDAWKRGFVDASSWRDRLQSLCIAIAIAAEIYAVYWVLTSYRFEPVIPVYQQF